MRLVHGCPCLPCRAAAATLRARYRRPGYRRPRARLPSRVGIRRRLEGLHALGWSGAQLGARLGMTPQAVFRLRNGPDGIHPGTAGRVIALYDELWDRHSAGAHRLRTARWAAREGFALPMAWDDDTIDDPAATPVGQPVGRVYCPECGAAPGRLCVSMAQGDEGRIIRAPHPARYEFAS